MASEFTLTITHENDDDDNLDFEVEFKDTDGDEIGVLRLNGVDESFLANLTEMRENLYKSENNIVFDGLNGMLTMSTTKKYIKFYGEKMSGDCSWTMSASYRINSEIERMLDYMIDVLTM
jgi:hypothetical protein